MCQPQLALPERNRAANRCFDHSDSGLDVRGPSLRATAR
jgi:hypothetical protein